MMTLSNTSDVLDTAENYISFGLLFYIAIMVAVLVFAIVSNGLVIYCIIRFKKLRTATNVFICNLSISDILLAGFVMPQKLHDITHDEDFHEVHSPCKLKNEDAQNMQQSKITTHLSYHNGQTNDKDMKVTSLSNIRGLSQQIVYFGEILCKIVNFCPILVITSSIYTLVGVSFERHQVVITENQGPKFTFRKLAIQIIFIWGFAIGVSTPTLLEYTVQEVQLSCGNGTKAIQSCGSQTTRVLALTNAIFVLIVSYAIPVVLLTRNYLEVAMFVWKKGKRMKENLEPSGRGLTSIRLFKQRTRIVKLLIVVALIFALSWLPFFVILIYAKATGNDASINSAGFINLLLLALANFSTAYNVVLYVIFNPSFKRPILGILKCKTASELQDEHLSNDQSQHTPVTPPEEENSVITQATSRQKISVIAEASQFNSLDHLEDKQEEEEEMKKYMTLFPQFNKSSQRNRENY